MPKTIGNITEMELKQVPLPTGHSKQYATVSHGYIIDVVKQELENKGYEINTEHYRCTHNGAVAQGIYYINHGNDPELGLMFAWCNSYDKSTRFKCAVGAHVFVCGNGMMIGDMANYHKKHYGDSSKVKALVKQHIETQIGSASNYYSMIQKDKEAMKLICFTEKEIAELMGCIFFTEDIISLNQLSISKKQYEKPSYDYNAPLNSLWSVYNHITFALKTSHPKNWMDQQADLHSFVVKNYLPQPAVIDPNQMNITDVIEDVPDDQLITSEVTPNPLDENAEIECSVPEGKEFNTPYDIPVETSEEQQEKWDDQTRLEEGLDHKGEIAEDEDNTVDDTTDTDVNEPAIDEEPAEIINEFIKDEEKINDDDDSLKFDDYFDDEVSTEDEVVETEEKEEEKPSTDFEVEEETKDELVQKDSNKGELELPDFEF